MVFFFRGKRVKQKRKKEEKEAGGLCRKKCVGYVPKTKKKKIVEIKYDHFPL